MFQLFHLLFKTEGYQYYTKKYHPCDRDLKFEELGKKYYGKIDTEIVKKIMSTSPIGDYAADCKITDSYLIKENGIWAFWGNTEGKTWNASNMNIDDYPGISPNVGPTGWVRIFGISGKNVDSERLPRTMKFTENPLAPRIIWDATINKNKRNDCSANIVDGDRYIYTLTKDRLIALDKETGLIEWKKEFKGSEDLDYFNKKIIVGYENGSMILDEEGRKLIDLIDNDRVSSVDLSKNLISVGTYDGDLYIFDKAGNLIKRMDLGNYPLYVKALKDKVIASEDNTCILVNNSGNTLWSLKVGGAITKKPTVDKDRLFLPCWDGKLYSIYLKNGSLNWSFKSGWGVDTTPYAKDGIVYIGSMDGAVYALNEKNGKMLWEFTTNGAIDSSPIVYGEYVFFGSDDGRFYAVNKSNGICKWSFTPRYFIENGSIYNYVTTPIHSSPVVENGTVFVSATSSVYALDAHTYEKVKEKETSSTKQIPSMTILIFVILPILLILLVVAVYLYITRK